MRWLLLFVCSISTSVAENITEIGMCRDGFSKQSSRLCSSGNRGRVVDSTTCDNARRDGIFPAVLCRFECLVGKCMAEPECSGFAVHYSKGKMQSGVLVMHLDEKGSKPMKGVKCFAKTEHLKCEQLCEENSVCEDGAYSNTPALCEYGGDCADCGKRPIVPSLQNHYSVEHGLCWTSAMPTSRLCSAASAVSGLPATCSSANSHGIVSSSSCDYSCLQTRCTSDPSCAGFYLLSGTPISFTAIFLWYIGEVFHPLDMSPCYVKRSVLLCNNTCPTAMDGVCDDSCPKGTDCHDCGVLSKQHADHLAQSSHPHLLCNDSCTEWRRDGLCQDGGSESDAAYCPLGTDCTDCGIRIVGIHAVTNAPGATPSKVPATSAPVTNIPSVPLPVTLEPSHLTSSPQTTEPSVSPVQPETASPEVSTAMPEMAQPKTAQPTTIEPKTAQPMTIEPKTTEPMTAQPEIIPKTVQPETAGPMTAELTAQPEIIPETVQPETAQPMMPTEHPDTLIPVEHPTHQPAPPLFPLCSNECGFSNDSICDDGGLCAYGTDCTDCGVRRLSFSAMYCKDTSRLCPASGATCVGSLVDGTFHQKRCDLTCLLSRCHSSPDCAAVVQAGDKFTLVKKSEPGDALCYVKDNVQVNPFVRGGTSCEEPFYKRNLCLESPGDPLCKGAVDGYFSTSVCNSECLAKRCGMEKSCKGYGVGPHGGGFVGSLKAPGGQRQGGVRCRVKEPVTFEVTTTRAETGTTQLKLAMSPGEWLKKVDFFERKNITGISREDVKRVTYDGRYIVVQLYGDRRSAVKSQWFVEEFKVHNSSFDDPVIHLSSGVATWCVMGLIVAVICTAVFTTRGFSKKKILVPRLPEPYAKLTKAGSPPRDNSPCSQTSLHDIVSTPGPALLSTSPSCFAHESDIENRRRRSSSKSSPSG
eukprot:TRINITY_DN15562_c0_g1_i1.p1 TRINITY_DN15562_c0_g1~~TRINITY_DN15562_c0_g1_i1.p1  ORF type:complete len:939 (+),score=122.53 TRINITY_DN15562_c0_g1_i1:60-2819(+)